MEKKIILNSVKRIKRKIKSTNPHLIDLINKQYSFTWLSTKGEIYETSDSSSKPQDKERITRFLNSYSC